MNSRPLHHVWQSSNACSCCQLILVLTPSRPWIATPYPSLRCISSSLGSTNSPLPPTSAELRNGGGFHLWRDVHGVLLFHDYVIISIKSSIQAVRFLIYLCPAHKLLTSCCSFYQSRLTRYTPIVAFLLTFFVYYAYKLRKTDVEKITHQWKL